MMMALVERQEAGTEARRVGGVVCLRNRKEAPAAGAPGAWEGRDGTGQTWQDHTGHSTPKQEEASEVLKVFFTWAERTVLGGGETEKGQAVMGCSN